MCGKHFLGQAEEARTPEEGGQGERSKRGRRRREMKEVASIRIIARFAVGL